MGRTEVKSFDYGDLYIVPWKIDGYKNNDLVDRYSIPDGSIVVILDSEKYESKNYYGQITYFYRLKLLTLDGHIIFVPSTPAALDYWKKIKNKNFNI